MNRPILVFLFSGTAAFAAADQPLTATAVTTGKDSVIHIPYDAKKLMTELASYSEVRKVDFYYPNVFPRAHVQGTATLSTGRMVEWFHYECGGLCLRFEDGSERYFLHPMTLAGMKAAKAKELKPANSK